MPKPVITRGEQRADRREREAHSEDRLDLLPARGKTALEEDQRQRDDADRLRHLEADEVDDVEPVRADDDAEHEEEHQTRHSRATGHQRRCDCEREQNTRDQN